jgi:hypothetical protein
MVILLDNDHLSFLPALLFSSTYARLSGMHLKVGQNSLKICRSTISTNNSGGQAVNRTGIESCLAIITFYST